MDNFNIVFKAIKHYSTDADFEFNEDPFKIISSRTDIPIDQLDLFLNALQHFGLIEYSWEDEFIQLTSFGKCQDRLFG